MGAKSRRGAKERLLVLAWLVPGALLLTAVLSQFGAYRLLENKLYDFTLRTASAPPPPTKSDVVLVVIDDQSLRTIPEPLAYWQPHFAEVLKGLSDAHARAVGLDLIFSAGDDRAKGEAKQLAQAFAEAGASGTPVVLGYDAATPLPSSPLYLLASTSSPRPLGYLNLPADEDDYVRRSDPCKPDDQEAAFSLAARVAASALGEEFACTNGILRTSKGTMSLDPRHSVFIPFGAVRTPERISFVEVLRLAKSKDVATLSKKFAGKLVIIGSDEPQDRHATPLLGNGVGRMPGMEIHATVAQALYSGTHVRVVPAGWLWLLAAGCALAIGAAVLTFRWEMSVVASLVLAASTVLPSLAAWHQLWLIPPAHLLVSGVLAGAIGFVYRYRTEFLAHKVLRNQFSQYVSPEVVEQIVENGVELGGSRRKITVLFSDIRGFTTLSERIAPENLVGQLNEYLSAMSEEIINHGGYLDKFIGDGILAIFGAPVEQKDAAWHAVNTANQMLERLAGLNARWKQEGRPEFSIGIGIHTGEAIVGNIGSWRKLEYTAVGDTVNTASRVESKTKDSIQRYNAHILISGATLEELERWDHFADVFAMDIEQLKGKTELTQLFVLRGLYGKGRKGSAANV